MRRKRLSLSLSLLSALEYICGRGEGNALPLQWVSFEDSRVGPWKIRPLAHKKEVCIKAMHGSIWARGWSAEEKDYGRLTLESICNR